MSTAANSPRRRLSSRRGSLSASDPFGLNADAETARGTASRITIVRATPLESESRHAHRASMSSVPGRSPGRLSFAFSSFNGNSPAEGARPNGSPAGPQSPKLFPRSNSSDLMPLAGRHASLTPQQICDLAASSIAQKLSPNPTASQPLASPFMTLPDEHYLPFLDRPAEVTSLLTSPPTSRLLALLAQTFPAPLRTPLDPNSPPTPLGPDPSKWSFAELSYWLQKVTRDEANDREWAVKARACVLARSELIWSRLKGALGVPPELEEENDDFDAVEDEAYTFGSMNVYGSMNASPITDDRETFVEVILPGDSPTCVGAVATPPEHAFGYGGMEIIGESLEDEGVEGSGTDAENRDVNKEPIQGLRISTSMIDLQPMSSPRSRPASPVVSTRRASSIASSATSGRSGLYASAGTDPGRVRRSRQQERGTGDPLFPSSFAKLTMGPSLVANNPALRSGSQSQLRAGLQYSLRRHRFSGGWDPESNEYAISLGSGSERSFPGR